MTAASDGLSPSLWRMDGDVGFGRLADEALRRIVQLYAIEAETRRPVRAAGAPRPGASGVLAPRGWTVVAVRGAFCAGKAMKRKEKNDGIALRLPQVQGGLKPRTSVQGEFISFPGMPVMVLASTLEMYGDLPYIEMLREG